MRAAKWNHSVRLCDLFDGHVGCKLASLNPPRSFSHVLALDGGGGLPDTIPSCLGKCQGALLVRPGGPEANGCYHHTKERCGEGQGSASSRATRGPRAALAEGTSSIETVASFRKASVGPPSAQHPTLSIHLWLHRRLFPHAPSTALPSWRLQLALPRLLTRTPLWLSVWARAKQAPALLSLTVPRRRRSREKGGDP